MVPRHCEKTKVGVLLALCFIPASVWAETPAQLSARCPITQYAGVGTGPDLPNSTLTFGFVSSIQGHVQPIVLTNGTKTYVYGAWSELVIVKAAMLAFLNGSVLTPPAQRAFTHIHCLYGDECLTAGSPANCTPAWITKITQDMLRGNTLVADNKFPPARGLIGGKVSYKNIGMTANGLDAPMISHYPAPVSPDEQSSYLSLFRTFSSLPQKVDAVIAVMKAYKYTRADHLTCDTIPTRKFVMTFKEKMLTANIDYTTWYWKPSKQIYVPPKNIGEVKTQEHYEFMTAQMLEHNCHVHVNMGPEDCAVMDHMSFLATKGLVGKGHFWMGDFVEFDTFYPLLYLPTIRYKVEEKTGEPSPYAFVKPFDGYLAVTDHPTQNSDLLREWLAKVAVAGTKNDLFGWFANHVTNQNLQDAKDVYWLGFKQATVQFDSAWAMLLAMNAAMLKNGSAFSRKALYDEVLASDFEGASGRVRFTSDGQRIAKLLLVQSRVSMTEKATTPTGQPDPRFWKAMMELVNMATYEETLNMDMLNMRFYEGATQPPPDLNGECGKGSIYVVQHNVCKECNAGRFSTKVSSIVCEECLPGSYASKNQMSQCLPCRVGRFVDVTSAAECKACKVGTYTDKAQQSECQICPAGRYSGVDAKECELCGIGTYQEDAGQSACRLCSEYIAGSSSIRAATSRQQCVCQEGQYWRPNVGCEDCITGMACSGGNKRPTQEAGYYVEVDDPSTLKTTVFQCVNPAWCPAGKLSACDLDRYGRSCAKIDSGTCPAYFWPAIAIFLLIVIYISYVVSSPQVFGKQSPVSMLAININICIVSMQSIGVYFQFFKDIPEEVALLAMLSQSFTFKLELLMPACNFGQEFATRFAAALFPPPLLLAFVGILYVITKMVRKPMDKDKTINIIGTFLQVMYVMQCKDAFGFICRKDNPSDVETLQYYTDVKFGSDEHLAAAPIIMDLYLFLVYVCGVFALFTYVVCKSPEKIKEDSFRNRWNFLLGKWRPCRMYWGLVLLLRNMFICLAPILVNSDRIYRSMFYSLCFLVHALAEARFMPWLSLFNASFEIVTSSFLIALSFAGLQFNDKSTPKEKKTAAILMFFWSGFIWILFFVSALYSVMMAKKGKEAKEEKKSQTGFNLLAKCNDIMIQFRDQKVSGIGAPSDRWVTKFKAGGDYDMHEINECYEVLCDMQDVALSWKRPPLAEFRVDPEELAGPTEPPRELVGMIEVGV